MLLLLASLSAHAVDNATLIAGLALESGWEEVDRKTVDGLEVVVRHKVVAGQDCLEGTTFAAVKPDKLLTAAADIPHQPAWSSWDMPLAIKLSPGADRFDYVQLLDNPRPVADRYWFTQGTRLVSGNDWIFRWEAIDAPTRYPVQLASLLEKYPGSVSASINVGDWTFTPINGSTRVRYRICTDAGGDLPRWIGEFAARTTLPTNLRDIVVEARKQGG